ncbi:type IV toxin-antitoxin system AbiEi family antitoxin domain-containing protein [Microbacterium halotolerans]|uniref:type IV toxin-antitoxin system AbiEi family antitoxin domain-containing protein n=1 Tax=Microbacterium halotolerans TaxID=246613 RepID=UPI0013C33001|nr:type IV toxin-antitoxin system AbiEi family antitoxin domain-containing protein [Microbacterium halotolerans]
MSELLTHSRSDLTRSGVSDRALREALRSGQLLRIRNGHFVDAGKWESAHPEQKEVAAARAAQRDAHGRHVFSHATAAALHGLPLFRHRPGRPHVMIGNDTLSGTSPAVARHHDLWDGETTERDGLLATTLVRTTFDVLRTCRAETAVACIDAAMRRVALQEDRRIDHHRAEEFRDEVIRLIRTATGKRGVKQARELTAFADPRAESPGESVSRMYLARLGFDGIEQQVPITAPNGRTYTVDFRVSGVLGEFDGARKYIDRGMRGGRSVEQVVLDEKRREDWIRARSGERLIRWTNQEITTPDHFLRFLRSINVWP